MKNTNHFIIDFETMGQDVFDVPIIDAAFYSFDWRKFTSNEPYTFEYLTKNIQTIKLDFMEQKNVHGCSYTQNDVDFWSKQGPEAKAKLKPSVDDVSVDAACDILLEYLAETKPNIWWSRGNSFDAPLLHKLMKWSGKVDDINKALKFWNVRDTRTFIDAKFDFSTRNGFCPISDKDHWKKIFNAHDSTHDVAADILRMQRIVRAENDLT